MTSENTKKRFVLGPMTKMIIGAAVIFAAVLLFTPQAGVLRTIPFLIGAGVVAALLDVKMLTCASLAGLFNLCIYFVCGGGVKTGVVYSILAVILVLAGFYVKKLLSIAVKTKKPDVRRKAIVLCVIAFVVAVLLSVVFCGNAVSFVRNTIDNELHVGFINKHYDREEKVYVKYSAFSPQTGEYRTYVTFKHDGNIVGADDECYVSRKGGVLTDCVRKYYENEMLTEAKKTLAGYVMNVTGAFEVTAADVVFEDGEVLDGNSEYTQYQDRVGYVVSFYSIIDNEDDFASLCYDVVTELKNNGFDYQEVLFCGGTSSEVLFFAKATPEIDYNEFSSKWCVHFDDHLATDSLKRYAVTEEMILGYWNNP